MGTCGAPGAASPVDEAVAARITLACAFCHAALPRAETAFCAACLAPHHADCFRGHGRCATAGCAERGFVRRTPAHARPAPARPRRVTGFVALAFAGAGWGVTLLVVAFGATRELERGASERERERERREVAERVRRFEDERRRAAAELLFLRLGEEEAAPDAARVEALWAELVRQGGERPTEAAERAARVSREEQEVEALLDEVTRLAKEQRIEELVEVMGRLRRAMNAAHVSPATRQRWSARISGEFGCRVDTDLLVFIQTGNQALRVMAAALRRDDWMTVDLGHYAIGELVKQMRAREREVFHRNAQALELRGDALFERGRTLRALSGPELVPSAVCTSPLGPPRCTIGGRDLIVGEVIEPLGAEPMGVEAGGLPVTVAAIGPGSVTLRCRDVTRVVEPPSETARRERALRLLALHPVLALEERCNLAGRLLRVGDVLVWHDLSFTVVTIEPGVSVTLRWPAGQRVLATKGAGS